MAKYEKRGSSSSPLFSTPGEFVRAMIRERKERQEAAEFRKAVLEGYDDVLHGRTCEYIGDLRAMLEAIRAERRSS